MIIHFSPEEMHSISVEYMARKELTSDYLECREKTWETELAKVKARNGNMWNGEIYTLEDIIHNGDDQVVLRMSSCEYKDIVFRFALGSQGIINQYGLGYLPRLIGVSCVPITLDGKFVFGIRADRVVDGKHPIGGIGGVLSMDEMKVKNFQDICSFMNKEISEETAINTPVDNLKFFALIYQRSTYHFCFTFKLPVVSSEVNRYVKYGEFSEMIALTQEETYATSSPITPMTSYWRKLLHFLPNVAES